MKLPRFVIAVLLSAASMTAVSSDIGISVSIGQPGFHGRVSVAGFPPPPLVYRQPIIVDRVPVGGPPVYFIQNTWYQRQYAPRYEQQRAPHYHRDGRRDAYEGRFRRARGDQRQAYREGNGRRARY